MITKAHILSFFTVVAVAAACNSPENDARKADEAAQAANEKIQKAEVEATEKSVEIQRKADEDIEKAQQIADKKVADARDVAERHIDRADASGAKAVLDIREDAMKRLASLDKEMGETHLALERKLSTTEANRLLEDMRLKRDAARASISTLEATQTAGLETVKKDIHARLDELQTSIRDAKKHL
jgi:hypothetical protein